MLTIEKAFENESVNIVFGTNDKYARYMAVAMQSLIEHCSENHNYDIIVFETDVNDELKSKIISMADGHDNISIRFLNVSSIYDNYDTEKLFCHLYFSKEMYLRLFIPEVLQSYEKAIYLDCDVIVQSDVAELFETDVEDNYIAACRDYNSIVNISYYPKVKVYFKEVLQIEDMNTYFNSGILVMNLPVLREVNLPEKTFELLEKYKELLYPDQDLLNLICVGHTKIMQNSWNFVFGINAALVQDNHFIDLAVDWSKGLADQKIIHYISEHKPWNTPEMSYADIWWKYAKKTPVYQELLKEYFDAHPEKLK